MVGKITKCDRTGDSVLAGYDTEKVETVEVAQKELTKWLTECITKYGKEPPVFGQRMGQTEFVPFDTDKDSIKDFAEVLVHPGFVGG